MAEKYDNRTLMVTVYDMVAEEAGPIFMAKNREVAKRMFRQMLDQEQVYNRQDLELYVVGYFSPQTMRITDVGQYLIESGSSTYNDAYEPVEEV